ncbi:unnamed protein product [Arctogadus glacialis]
MVLHCPQVLQSVRFENIPILRITKGYEAGWYPGQVHAATTIQKNQRTCVARQRFRDREAAALAVQTILRAYMARQKYQALLRESKAGVIQKHVRALLARRAAQRRPHHDGEASGSRDHPCERTPSCAA